MNYRQYIKKNFLTSHAHYRMNGAPQNMTPWGNMFFTWHRMPYQEYEAYHRFNPYYVIGQIDHSKEVLIPTQKVIDGHRQDGYDVILPLYCYEGGRLNWASVIEKKGGESVEIEKAALIINRGWIPAYMKDKRERPWETDSNKLVKVQGTFRKGKDVHDYKKPNDPDSNMWHNLALEDIAYYFELPNIQECKFYYF